MGRDGPARSLSAGAHFVQFAGRELHLDGPEGVAADLVGVVVEGDAVGRHEEVLRGGDVVGEEPRGGEPFVVRRVVLLEQFQADAAVDLTQLLRREEVRRAEFVAVAQRVVVVVRGVGAVCAAQVARPHDDIGEERVDNRALGLDRNLVGRGFGPLGQIGQALPRDLVQGAVGRFGGGPGELLEFKEVADVGLFDGSQGFRGVGIADGGEAVFHAAAGRAVPQQRVDGALVEVGSGRAGRAGDRKGGCGEWEQGGESFHGRCGYWFGVKIGKKGAVTRKIKKNHIFCPKILEF